jgi:hypothetical protein
MGAKVIMFKDFAKLIDFNNTYAKKVLNQNEFFWIGAEASIPKVFYWYDDQSSLPTWFWHNAEPNFANNNEYCVFCGGQFLMADLFCGVSHRTICEYSY